MNKIASIVCILILFTTPVPASAAETPASRPTAPATWHISGTTVVFQPAQPFESGFVRVVGPDGYRARRSFDANTPPALDLVADGYLERFERGSHDAVAAGEEPRRRNVRRAPITLLPDGHYRFEAFLSGPTGTHRVDGSVFARADSLARPAAPSEVVPSPDTPRKSSESVASLGGPSPNFATETERITIADANNNGYTALKLDANNTSGTTIEDWELYNWLGDFRLIERDSGDQNPILTVLNGAPGRTGLGTTAPVAQLHLSRTGFGYPTLRMEDICCGDDYWWQLESVSGALYFASQSDGRVVAFHQTGEKRVEIGTNLTVEGDFTVTSSRTAKQNFLPVDPQAVLDRIAELPIHEWEYRDSSGARHVGPVAEDFREAFHLGSSKTTISPTDLSGVALAAIKGLHAKVEEQHTATAALLAAKNLEIERLTTERELLSERLAGLEEKVDLLLAASGD